MSVKRLSLFLVCLLSLDGIRICSADGLDRFDSPASWQEDAELNDVFFFNDRLGWAVGAQGLILRTVDGGKHWAIISTVPELNSENVNLNQKLRGMRPLSEVDQLKPVRCRFETVHFANPNTGWIAGGYEYPNIDQSRAIVMKTNDGGLTWHQISGLVLPRIKKLKFENELEGWAIGDKSNLYPTGIYKTADGGHSWSSHSEGSWPGWLTGVATSSGFVLLDDQHRLSRVSAEQSEVAVVLDKTRGDIRDLIMLDDQRGLAVGAAGTLLKTDNGGLSWHVPPQLDLPLLRQIDFHAVACTADKFWVVGFPGTQVISIDKRTGHVNKYPTSAHAPLNKIVFFGEKNGWAVGGLGTIVATQDGGETWHRQRGLSRVALLNIFGSPRDAPLELMARYASEEDLITANVLVGDARNTVADLGLLRQASERVGASCTLEIPTSRGRDDQNLESLVRTIRTLRPNLISTGSNLKINALVRLAIQHSARPESFQHHAKNLGLEPWQVDRIVSENEQGQLKLDRRRLLARSGLLIEDHVGVSRALLGLDLQMENTRSYRVTNISGASHASDRDLFDGLNGFGREVPTRAVKGRRGNLAVIRTMSQKQKAMEQLSQWQIETPQQALQWRQNVQAWIGFLPPETAGIWVSQLAELYLIRGQPELAAMAMELIVRRWPTHALGPSSMVWLVQYYRSSEFAQIAYRQSAQFRKLVELDKSSQAIGTMAVKRDGNVVQSIWIPVAQEKLLSEKQEPTEASADLTDGRQPITPYEQFAMDRRQQASLFLSRLRQRDPDLVLGKEFRFVESKLTLQRHGWQPAANLMKQISQRGAEHPAFALAALRELQIQDEDRNPSHMVFAARAADRPFLDGKPDDPIWNKLKTEGRLVSQATTGSRTGQPDWIGFAYDAEFLYVFCRNQKITGQGYDTDDSKPDHRDPELGRRDRIEIRIDTDRDYCTAMVFTVDHRGWASESCAGSIGWNPDWFVAQSQDKDSWSVELAIPLEGIAGMVPDRGDVWAIDVRRLSYDSSSLWEPGITSGPDSRDWEKRGLQAGLRSHPSQFQLLEFE